MKHQNIEDIPTTGGFFRLLQKILYSRCFRLKPFNQKYFNFSEKDIILFQSIEDQHLYFKNVGLLFL